jgi:glycosyltransferase involved in cell wall biosynthesis
VVIPTFNSAKTIWRALESVRQQTLSPEQVVVVDNASTDDTCAEVERFFLSFPP